MPTITIRKEVSRAELREMLYEQILNHGPEHFDQTNWYRTSTQGAIALYNAPGIDLNECGTTACLAGHAAALAARVNLKTTFSSDSFAVSGRLGEEFGIERAAFDYLATSWPKAMRDAYEASKRVNPNEQDAQWWGALQYLISLRGKP